VNVLTALEYWDNQYFLSEGIEHHAEQNELLARDLSNNIQTRFPFREEINEKLVFEVGCGTGDLAHILTDRHYCGVEASDLSGLAVEIASIRFPHLIFKQHDILRDKPLGTYEVVVASNVIEHFKNPRRVINKMFKMAPAVLIVAPYNQPITDGYDTEGGAGHVSTITYGTFDPYRVAAGFLFHSRGWQFSSAGETPTQIAVILKQK
jgi:SAM-dependent methyltransferase